MRWARLSAWESAQYIIALFGRPEILVTTCARMHSSEDAVCPANLYVKEASRTAPSSGIEKVSRTIRERANSAGWLMIVIVKVGTVVSPMYAPDAPHATTLSHSKAQRINMTGRIGDSLLGEVCKCR